MNKNVYISIIVPVYRTEKYLKKCVDSLLNQSYTNFEVVFVDDGSDDSSASICDNYCKIDKRFKVIHKENAGLGYARNSGLEIIEGDYFTFLDSDDWFDENHIEKMVEGTMNGKADLVIGGCKHCTEEKVISTSNAYKNGLIQNERIIEDILLPIIAPPIDSKSEMAIPMSVCFNLYKTTLVKENNLLFLSERDIVGEDFFFNLRYLTLCKEVNYLNWHGYNYRINENSITRLYNPKRLERTERFYSLIKQHIKELGLEDKVGYRPERSALSKFRSAIRLASSSYGGIKYQYNECKRILNSEVLKAILNTYPIESYRRKSIRVTTFLMKYRLVFPILFVFKMEKFISKGR